MQDIMIGSWSLIAVIYTLAFVTLWLFGIWRVGKMVDPIAVVFGALVLTILVPAAWFVCLPVLIYLSGIVC